MLGQEIARLTIRLTLDTAEYTKGLADTEKATNTFGNTVKGIAKAGIATAVATGTAAFAGLTAAVVTSTQKATDLQQQLSGVAAVTGASNEQITLLRGLVDDLGLDPNLKVSAFEAADAIEMLGRNGLTVQEIMDGAARSTVLLANATGGDFALSADIATDTMALFGISATNMETAVNGITSVVNNSKFSIEDYALALAQGGGVAASVGVEFDDFNTTIAAISPLFASGSDAGTSFKTLLQSLPGKSGPAKDALAELGIITEDGTNRFFDAEGQMKSMAEISGLLADATKGLSEEQINQAFSTAFGTDAMRAAFGLAKIGEGDFKALQATMGNTSAADNAATRMDNLAGSTEILAGIIETLQLGIGDKFLPIWRGWIDAAAEFLSNNAEPINAFFADLAKFVEKAGEIFFAFAGELKETVGPAMVIINQALTDLAASFGYTGEEVTASDVILKLLKLTLDAIVIGVKAVAVGLNLLATGVETVRGLWSSWFQLLGWTSQDLGIVDLATTGLKKSLDILLWPVRTAVNLFNDMTGGLNGIKNSVNSLLWYIGQLKNDLAGLRIPSWLTPGSPTPFELGLRGIANEIRKMPELSFGLPDFSVAGAGAGAGMGATTNDNRAFTVNNYGAGNRNTGVDLQTMRAFGK